MCIESQAAETSGRESYECYDVVILSPFPVAWEYKLDAKNIWISSG